LDGHLRENHHDSLSKSTHRTTDVNAFFKRILGCNVYLKDDLPVGNSDGKQFESQVAKIVTKMVASGELPYRSELVRFKPKAKYFSRTRNADVDFENVLEVYVSGNFEDVDAQPTHVIIFECKDHGRLVEVSKIDELVGRLAGGYGFNIKGYMVTRNGFQSGALATAKSNGIGLIKIMPDEKVQFLSHFVTYDMIERKNREFPQRVNLALQNPNYESDGESFYAVDNGYVFSSLLGVIAKHFHDSGISSN
jgi:hypothetical protein